MKLSRLITGSHSQEIDRLTIDTLEISGVTLMELAGFQAANSILNRYSDESLYTIICGGGNNGGDGLVVARHLILAGKNVRVILTKSPNEMTPDALLNLQRVSLLQKLKYTYAIENFDSHNPLNSKGLIVDALFGTGLHSAVREPYLGFINEINESGLPIVALDIPSGLDSDSGCIYNVAVKANVTLSFGFGKTGLWLDMGPTNCGDVKIVGLGFPEHFIKENRYLCIPEISNNDSDIHYVGHKYKHGIVHVIGGSEAFSGAVILSSKAAWSTGIGAEYVMVPSSIHDIVSKVVIEPVTLSVGNRSFFTLEDADSVINQIKSKHGIVLIGNGLGDNEKTKAFCTAIFATIEANYVVDADGLLAITPEIVKQNAKSRFLLTPHSGELNRIFNRFYSAEAENDYERLKLCEKLCSDFPNVIMVSKGKPLIITDRNTTYISGYDTSKYNRFGFGDVLAGLISGYWAQDQLQPVKAISNALNRSELRYQHHYRSGSRPFSASDLV